MLYKTCLVQNYSHTCTHTHIHFTALWTLSGISLVSRYQKGKTNLDFTEQETVSGSGISWAICKSAPHPKQITTPASHHSVFLQDVCPSCHPTNSVKALTQSKRRCCYFEIDCWWHCIFLLSLFCHCLCWWIKFIHVCASANGHVLTNFVKVNISVREYILMLFWTEW